MRVPERFSICFVAPAMYPVLAGVRDRPVVGGAEVQQCFIATELARRGHRVSMISMDYGQREGDVVRGVRSLRMHAPDEGIPLLRFLHPRLTSLWSAMRRADADVFYQRSSGVLTGLVAAFARRHGRRSIYAAAHDHDFDPMLPSIRYGRDRAIFRWGIRNVSSVVVQSEHQRIQCSTIYGREGLRIDSCYAHDGVPARQDGVVLWVATAKRAKRPHLFLELARRLPQYRFRLVGGPVAGEAAYFEQLRAAAAALPNLELCGFVPYADVERQFDGASIFVNTSLGEGFPNTFLQAWSRAMPTLSFFDSASMFDGWPVGIVVPDLDVMEQALLQLKTDVGRWRDEGERARRLVDRRHSVAGVVDDYEHLLASLVAAPAASAKVGLVADRGGR